MNIPEGLLYTKDHEWIRVEGVHGQVGITDYAQQQLGDIVFVELPEVGVSLSKGEQFGSIESVKAVSDLFCPVSGEVTEVNTNIVNQPEMVNKTPYTSWLIVVKLANEDEVVSLLDSVGYGEIVK